jgi:ABC-type transport system substrate-binding protein
MRRTFVRAGALAAVATAAFIGAGTAGAADFTLKYALFGASQQQLGGNALDPAKASFRAQFQVLYMTCANLYANPDVDLQGSGRAVPEVSDGPPDISNGDRTYTFTLKTSYRFSDGSPVTPSAYATEIERVKTNPVFAKYAADMTAVPNDPASTLTITLTAPRPDLLDRLAMPLFCPVPPNTGSSPSLPLPASGPYMVSPTTTAGSTVTLVRNPNYAGNRPRNASTIEVVDASPNSTSFDTNGYDAADNLSDFSAVTGSSRYLARPSNQLNYLALNTTRVLTDPELRLAVNYAVDRGALAGAGETPWSQYLTPAMPGFTFNQVFPLSPDTAAASARVAASSAPNKSLTIYCRAAQPPRLPESSFDCANRAPAIKSSLEAVGFGPVGITPQGNLFEAVSSPSGWDIAYLGWVADYVDPANTIVPLFHRDNRPAGTPPSGTNYSFWDSNTSMDGDGVTWTQRMNNALTSPAPDRYDAFGQLATELAGPAPIAALSHGNWRYYFSSRVACQKINTAYGLTLGSVCIPDVQTTSTAGVPVSSGTTTSSSDPVATSVTTPSGGAVTISETAASNEPTPSGYSFFGQQVIIEAPQATQDAPLILKFSLDSSLLAGADPLASSGADPNAVQLFRNGSRVDDCTTASGAYPDPCVVRPATQNGTGWDLTVRTSHASNWNMGRRFDASFGGFLAPVAALPAFNTVKAKAGGGVPVKFKLGSDLGLSIFQAGYPKSVAVTCPGSQPVVAATPTPASGGLAYDASIGQYTYTWKTDKAFAGKCRQLILRFANGFEAPANFQFTK